MGLATAQGAYNVNPWVNAGDAETKAFIDKFIQRRKVFPASFQVGNYSAAKSYLKAVEAASKLDRPKEGHRQNPSRRRVSDVVHARRLPAARWAYGRTASP